MTIHTRPEIELDPQRCFKPMQKARMFERAKGRCEVVVDEYGVPIPASEMAKKSGERCNRKITGTWIAGHFPKAHYLGGPTKIFNGRVECRQCAKYTQSTDTSEAARCERMAGRKGQWAKRKRRGPTLKSNGKLKGRGFPSKEERAAAKAWKQEQEGKRR